MCAGNTYWCHFSAKSVAISTNGSLRSESSRSATGLTVWLKDSTTHDTAQVAVLRGCDPVSDRYGSIALDRSACHAPGVSALLQKRRSAIRCKYLSLSANTRQLAQALRKATISSPDATEQIVQRHAPIESADLFADAFGSQ
jgi:hypothetical protein